MESHMIRRSFHIVLLAILFSGSAHAQLCTCYTTSGDTIKGELKKVTSFGVSIYYDDLFDDNLDVDETVAPGDIRSLVIKPIVSKPVGTGTLIGFLGGIGLTLWWSIEEDAKGERYHVNAPIVKYVIIPLAMSILTSAAGMIAGWIVGMLQSDTRYEINGSEEAYALALPELLQLPLSIQKN